MKKNKMEVTVKELVELIARRRQMDLENSYDLIFYDL